MANDFYPDNPYTNSETTIPPTIDLTDYDQYDGLIPMDEIFNLVLYTRELEFRAPAYTPKGMRYSFNTILENKKTLQAVFKTEIFGYVPEFIHESDRYLDPYHDLKISCDNVPFLPGIYLSSEGIGKPIWTNDLYQFELTYRFLREVLSKDNNNPKYDQKTAEEIYDRLGVDPDVDSLATIAVEYLKSFLHTRKLGYTIEDAKLDAERLAIINYLINFNRLLESDVIGMKECLIHKGGDHTILL